MSFSGILENLFQTFMFQDFCKGLISAKLELLSLLVNQSVVLNLDKSILIFSSSQIMSNRSIDNIYNNCIEKQNSCLSY